MPELPSNFMGYDRAITVFSPDGRLLQVEYARKTVQQGTPAVGIVCKNAVILVADKRIIDKLVVPSSIEKVAQIDDHIGATMSGLISDGRILLEKAQEEAQQHRMVYDEPTDVMTLVKRLCNHKQMYTQYAGTRPFGVSLLIGGIEKDIPKLFVTEPSGIFFEYRATAIGKNSDVINKMLENKYKDNMKINEGLNLAISALKKVLGKKFEMERIDVAVISEETKGFSRLSSEDISKYMKKKK